MMAPHPDVGRIGLAEARRALGQAVAEADFQRTITGLLDLGRWRWHHETDSRRSKAGLPDLIAVRRGQLLFIELKKTGGRVSPTQQEWLDDLGQVSSVGAHLWFPNDFNRAKEILL